MTEKTTNAASTEVNKDDKQENADQDGFWKELIKRFCYSLIKRAIPELYEKVDLEKEPRPLDKEFTDVVNIGNPNFRVPPHFADLVFEVPLKDGSNTWIIFHVEAQVPKGGNLPERRNHYSYNIYAH